MCGLNIVFPPLVKLCQSLGATDHNLTTRCLRKDVALGNVMVLRSKTLSSCWCFDPPADRAWMFPKERCYIPYSMAVLLNCQRCKSLS